jgi:hypothetical protein
MKCNLYAALSARLGGLKRMEAGFRTGLRNLGKGALSGVRFGCSDMWRPFLKVLRAELPEALHVLDCFHIAAPVNGTVTALQVVLYYNFGALPKPEFACRFC